MKSSILCSVFETATSARRTLRRVDRAAYHGIVTFPSDLSRSLMGKVHGDEEHCATTCEVHVLLQELFGSFPKEMCLHGLDLSLLFEEFTLW